MNADMDNADMDNVAFEATCVRTRQAAYAQSGHLCEDQDATKLLPEDSNSGIIFGLSNPVVAGIFSNLSSEMEMEMENVKDQVAQPAAEAPAAEAMINDQPRTFASGELAVGDVTHQGDVILIRIGEQPKQLKPRADRQLAEGNTQGSRHILVGGELWDGEADELRGLIKEASGKDVQEKYIGPVFQGGELTHPEHGNQTFPADELFVCVYQRNLDAEEREERVRD